MNNRLVFDCNIFAQALLNPQGPAGRCLELGQTGQVELFVSEFVLDDAAYVNLAIAAKAKAIISRDKHLLGLSDLSKPWSNEFRQQFPGLRVLTPDRFLVERQKARTG